MKTTASLLSLILLSGCTHLTATDGAPAALRGPSSVHSREIFEGLWAAPGSPERLRSAQHLQMWLDETARSTAPARGAREADVLNYKITKNLFSSVSTT